MKCHFKNQRPTHSNAMKRQRKQVDSQITIKTKARIYLIPRKMKTLSTKREQQQTINKQQHNGQLPMGLDRIYFIVKVFANCFAVVLTQIRLHSDNYDALAELSLCTD